jgi:hypothetical protein
VLARGETETSCGDTPPRARPALGFTGAQYEPRRPESTVLHDLVREHLGAFLGRARDAYEKPLPRYVEKAFHEYLRCGVFAHGFLRFHCDDCGDDLLVAFSCKGRGVCPSCGQRRMCNTAAHLVDRVLPSVPVRQWVLSLPFELRRTAAFRADVATALGRIFIEEVAANQKDGAGISGTEHGAVNFLQRFGGSLNLNLHFHAMVLDGVFTRARVRFPPPPQVARREPNPLLTRKWFSWRKWPTATTNPCLSVCMHCRPLTRETCGNIMQKRI